MSARSPVDENHLSSLRARVALSFAKRVVKSAILTSSGVLVNVDFVLSRSGRGPDDHEQCAAQLFQIARCIKSLLEDNKDEKQKSWLFAVARGPPHRENDVWPIILTASSEETLRKSVARLHAKFLGRVVLSESEFEANDLGENSIWLGQIKETDTPEHDKALLWEVVRGTSTLRADPSLPPPGARNAAQLVISAQMRLERLSPEEAYQELWNKTSSSPIILIDIRTAVQRSVNGVIPSAVPINRVFLEFALDPRSPERLPAVEEHKYNLRPIVFDMDGTASSLAAASLHDLGLLQATDVVGGFNAWKKAGLPITIDYS